MTPGLPSVLIVDDERANLDLMVGLLKADYRTLVATGGEQALRRASGSPQPDLVLLDVMMPGMDGYEVCRRLKADAATKEIPVIFVTAMSEVGDETAGFALGAVDYITKPVSAPIVLARVKAHLENKQARDFIADRNRILEEMVAERTRELAATQDATIISLATLAETRDQETGNHIRRTQAYVRALARRLAREPRFAPFLDDRSIDLLTKSAPLHDIGKVGVPDAILRKPGKLTEPEWEEMKRHTVYGHDAIAVTERVLEASGASADASSFLRFAKEITLSHHEKWDGTGYPQGRRGEAIPLSARLMALADVYDALLCRRVYKAPLPHEEVVAQIAAAKGSHFDPDVVDAFASVAEEFVEIAAGYAE